MAGIEKPYVELVPHSDGGEVYWTFSGAGDHLSTDEEVRLWLRLEDAEKHWGVFEQASETAERERDEAREALKVAHHALTTVHGLYATDQAVGDRGHFNEDVELFRIDTLKALLRVEKAMGDE